MSGPFNKRIAFYSVITAIIIVIGIILPLYHFYDPLFEHNPAISVNNGYYKVTYSGNFKNITERSTLFTFSTDTSTAFVYTAGHPNSTLNVSLAKGNIIYNKVENQAIITYNLSVGGHFTSYLHPSALILSIDVTGKNTTISTWAPPVSTFVPTAENLTPNNLGYLSISGPGNVSVLTKLLNYSNQVQFYNFFVSVTIQINVAWNPASINTFVMGAQVKGLVKPVDSTLSMTIVETN